jgi:hypothetical protein
MSDQFVSKIGNQYVVTVCYVADTGEVESASFCTHHGFYEVVWNLVTVGGGSIATFASEPLKVPEGGDPSTLGNVRTISPTQCAATLDAKGPSVQAIPYSLQITKPGGALIRHDPSIIVSEDPVEIP